MRSVWTAVIATALLASAAPAQERWNWSEELRPGQVLEIKGVNGRIEAVAARGNASVDARKTAGRSDPDDVRLVVVRRPDGYTICAVYPTPRGAREPNECQPGDRGRNSVNNNDVRVDFTVRVPQGVRFIGRTVNGGVTATGLSAETRGHTVNGSVEISTAGVAYASSVNGSIRVDLGRADWDDALEFETVNGSITVVLPADIDTHVNASTVTGSIDSDFPLTVKGRFGPKRLSGTIGSGGRELSLGTVNGNIELRKQ